MIHDCAGPECDMPVENHGDTCSIQCYNQWFAYKIHDPNELVLLQEDELVPNIKYDQPWYQREVRR